jgi:hypothetical protein
MIESALHLTLPQQSWFQSLQAADCCCCLLLLLLLLLLSGLLRVAARDAGCSWF